MMRVVFNGAEVREAFARRSRAIRPSRRALLRQLAIQTERAAIELSSGAGAPGAYPIPIRTGHHRRGFGFELRDDHALVFNTGVAARALHDGFRPYGNPNATPIRARPYFSDALKRLDIDAAADAWRERMG